MILALIASLLCVWIFSEQDTWQHSASLASCFFFGFAIILFLEPKKQTTKNADGRGWTQQSNLFGKN